VAGGLFCRLAIGARSRQCEVHSAFRCIVVVDTQKAYTQLPSPLLNRFEKQCVSRADCLSKLYQRAQRRLWQWCLELLKDSGNWSASLEHGDDMRPEAACALLQRVFVGFNTETLGALLLSEQVMASYHSHRIAPHRTASHNRIALSHYRISSLRTGARRGGLRARRRVLAPRDARGTRGPSQLPLRPLSSATAAPIGCRCGPYRLPLRPVAVAAARLRCGSGR